MSMTKKIKQLFWFLISNFLLINVAFGATRDVGNTGIRDGLIDVSKDSITKDIGSPDGLSVLAQIFVWVKTQFTSLVMLVAVAVFLYIGAKLAMSRGNPEEFKKAIMQLVFAIVGIFIVAAAWALVTLVAGINL